MEKKQQRRKYNRRYYLKNKGKCLEIAKRYRIKHKNKRNLESKNYRIKRLQFIRNYKKDKSCACCGYKKHTEILQFHHLKDKLFQLSRPTKISKIKKEIKKCILLCPNCHALMHSCKVKKIS